MPSAHHHVLPECPAAAIHSSARSTRRSLTASARSAIFGHEIRRRGGSVIEKSVDWRHVAQKGRSGRPGGTVSPVAVSASEPTSWTQYARPAIRQFRNRTIGGGHAPGHTASLAAYRSGGRPDRGGRGRPLDWNGFASRRSRSRRSPPLRLADCRVGDTGRCRGHAATGQRAALGFVRWPSRVRMERRHRQRAVSRTRGTRAGRRPGRQGPERCGLGPCGSFANSARAERPMGANIVGTNGGHRSPLGGDTRRWHHQLLGA